MDWIICVILSILVDTVTSKMATDENMCFLHHQIHWILNFSIIKALYLHRFKHAKNIKPHAHVPTSSLPSHYALLAASPRNILPASCPELLVVPNPSFPHYTPLLSQSPSQWLQDHSSRGRFNKHSLQTSPSFTWSSELSK